METRQLERLSEETKSVANRRALITARTLAAVQAMWNPRSPMDINAWFELNAGRYDEVVSEAQFELALIGGDGVDMELARQGYRDSFELTVDPEAFSGVDGSGRPVMGLAYAQAAKIAAMQSTASAPELASAWSRGASVLLVATQTALADASRQAKMAQLHARPGSGWIRLATPPCCSRCAVLAGRKASGPWVGFRRHPRCDCDAIPVHDYGNRSSSELAGWVFDPDEYFRKLSQREQDRIFTKAGAAAIRDGADIGQVVNSRRGMSLAVDRFGNRSKVTDEGTTKRGWASDYLRTQYGTKLEKRGGRYRRTARQRLMPEEIYKIAGEDRDMAVSLLHKNGYLTDASPSLDGRRSYFPRDAEVRAAQERIFERQFRS